MSIAREASAAPAATFKRQNRKGCSQYPQLRTTGHAYGPVVHIDRALFGAESEDGVDGGSAPSGQVTCDESNGEKEETRGHDGG